MRGSGRFQLDHLWAEADWGSSRNGGRAFQRRQDPVRGLRRSRPPRRKQWSKLGAMHRLPRLGLAWGSSSPSLQRRLLGFAAGCSMPSRAPLLTRYLNLLLRRSPTIFPKAESWTFQP